MGRGAGQQARPIRLANHIAAVAVKPTVASCCWLGVESDAECLLRVLQGYNCVGAYRDEDESFNLMLCTSDPDNGQLPDGATAAGQDGGAGCDVQQARDSTDKEPGQAHKGSRPAARAGPQKGNSSSSVRPAGRKVKHKDECKVCRG